MSEVELALARWVNFYVSMSAAAATLIGLLFVVIALAAGGQFVKNAAEGKANIHAYLTPTVVYFSSVLGLAALLTFPNHTRISAALCITIAGAVGLLYSVSTIVGIKKGRYYRRHDVLPYEGLPFSAYALLVAGGIVLFHDTQLGLTFAAIGMLLLLGTGIRNSWAIATTLVVPMPNGPP